jgi:CBS domain-containing protein
MKAKDAMTSPPITVGPETPLRDVGSLLSRHRISAVPVVDPEGNLLGLLAERELITADVDAAEGSGSRSTQAGHVMNRNAACVHEDADLHDVARMLLEPDVRRVLVVRDREVLGVISRRDLVKWLARSDATLAGEVRSVLHDQGLRLAQLDVRVEDGVAHLSGVAATDTLALAAKLARTVPGVVDARARDVGA